MRSKLNYFFSRAFAADLLVFLAWLAYSALLLPGVLAVSTFHPFNSSAGVLAAVALLSGLLALGAAWLGGLRGGLLAFFGYQAEETEFSVGGLRLRRSRRSGEPGKLRPRALLPFAFTLPALALCSAGLLALTHLAWHARFRALAREAKGRGLPVTLADFAEGLPPGAYAYASLEKTLEGFSEDPLRSAPYQKTALRKWDPGMRAAAGRLAAHYDPFLEKEFLPLLPRFAGFRPVDYAAVSRDPDILPEFRADKYFQVARLLRLSALVRACRGDMPGAWLRLEQLFLFADLVARDRSLEVKLVALSLRGQAVEAALTALRNAGGAALPERLTARLGALQDEHLVRQGVGCELANKLDFRRAYELPIISGRRKMVHLEDCHGGASSEEALLNLGARFLTLAGAFDAGHFRAAEYLAGQAQDETRPYESTPRSGRWPLWPYTIAHFDWPQYTGFYLKETELKAWARLALLVSALEERRSAAGLYPEDLGALALKGELSYLLTDPTSGKSFEYSPGPGRKAFTLCAIGRDGDRKTSGREDFCVRQER